MHLFLLHFAWALLVRRALSVGFDYEQIQLTQSDIAGFDAIAFGDEVADAHYTGAQCKSFPGDRTWPTDAEWSRLNFAINGNLLKPTPPAAVCYKGSSYNARACQYLVRVAGYTHFWLDDPVSVLTQWPEGSTCMPAINAVGNCTQGGFPTYVANVTNVKHVQAAVNFARNRNIRLIIKNTGHDFGGRSVGFGSLSIWTHHLKDFQFFPEYTMGEYTGMAVQVGAGVEAWELFNYMADNNITVVAAGGITVGANGGWLALGGHSTIVSFYGLGSDQALELHVVTANGKYVVATPYQNADLFFALRGGGGSTYGVIISVVMKAYPPLTTMGASVSLSYNNATKPISGNASATEPPFRFPGAVDDVETFWAGVQAYYKYGQKIVDAGGIGYTFIYNRGNGSYSFSGSNTIPNTTAKEMTALTQPLFDELAAVNISMNMPRFFFPEPYAIRSPLAPGEPLANTRYRSRLFPRKNWQNDTLFNETFAAIRTSIEAGYTFHAIVQSPTYKVAGWPGRNSAVNPAWRVANMHASLYGNQPLGLTPQQAREDEARCQSYVDLWRKVTPGSGAYMNEGDPGEPNWQQSFYGNLYDRLVTIKRKHDPWGVFYAATTPGSESWNVTAFDDYPNSQNGLMCRARAWSLDWLDDAALNTTDDGLIDVQKQLEAYM